MATPEAGRGPESLHVTPIQLRIASTNFGGGYRYPDAIEHVLEEVKRYVWSGNPTASRTPLIIMGQECPSSVKGVLAEAYLQTYVRENWGEGWGASYHKNPQMDKLGTVFVWSPELELVAETYEELPAPSASFWSRGGPIRVRQAHFSMFRDKATGNYYAGANTHLDVYPPGKAGAEHRPIQMQAAEQHFTNFIALFREQAENRGEHPYILPFIGGDVNTAGGFGSERNAREAQDLLNALQAGGREYIEITDQSPSSNKLANVRQAVVERFSPGIIKRVGHDFEHLYEMIPAGIRRNVRTYLMEHINTIINRADELRDRIYVQHVHNEQMQISDIRSETVRLGERGQRPSPTDHRRTIVLFSGNLVTGV